MINDKGKFNFVKNLIVFSMILMLALTGCSKQSVDDSIQKEESSKTAETKAYEPDTGYKKFSCEEDSSEMISAYVQLDINPSFILGMTGDCKVLSITANNEDAEDVLNNSLGDYFENADEGVELEYVLQDLAKATKQCGYIKDTFNVNVTVISGSIEENTFANACDAVTKDLSENDGIEASFERVEDNNGNSSDNAEENQQGTAEENQQEAPVDEVVNDMTCDMCHGSGQIVCDLCNGEGIMIEIEEVETEVRNDYVCPYCGGEGILDDGLHGGETAVCGHCGGEGRTGSMSGDFRELAYDTEIIEQEVERPCSRCNGEGVMTCDRCNGTGVLH